MPEYLNQYIDLIEAGAIVVSALGVIGTIVWANHIARRRATLDILLMEESRPEWMEQRTAFNKLSKQGDLSKWATKRNINSDDTALIRAILNRYELVSIGIHRGTIDEKSYRRWCRTILVTDWIACKPFVAQLRENNRNPSYFCEFEKLACRWANAGEKPRV